MSRWIGELKYESGGLLFDRQSDGLVVVLGGQDDLLLPKAKVAIDICKSQRSLRFQYIMPLFLLN
ncbi:hypothetical protein VIN01S_02470 [Vibrio inusitatus NBRC 102082]|uniref:Uncharacterized protein n=1 Tax=Vibrio inusitatus NBRC 102082 TaxID=1219070 RepID=A0A4Y3HQM6_9VIBR|nr:hypothetical protein [Vibrio inusitatus]GEA49443.1 hypothetical protein VIN01S_02470 [Vibrio inusitatus NBRC 102082]